MTVASNIDDYFSIPGRDFTWEINYQKGLPVSPILRASNYAFPMWTVRFNYFTAPFGIDRFIYECFIEKGDNVLGFGAGDSQYEALEIAMDNYEYNRTKVNRGEAIE